jgi:putative flippase GtrA
LFRRAALQALVYGTISVVNTAIDFSLFLVFVNVFGWRLAVANICSWCCALVPSCFLHSHVTFRETRDRTNDLGRSFAYFAVAIIGVVVGTGTLLLAAHWISAPLAKAVSLVISFAATFALNKGMVFARRLAL